MHSDFSMNCRNRRGRTDTAQYGLRIRIFSDAGRNALWAAQQMDEPGILSCLPRFMAAAPQLSTQTAKDDDDTAAWICKTSGEMAVNTLVGPVAAESLKTRSAVRVHYHKELRSSRHTARTRYARQRATGVDERTRTAEGSGDKQKLLACDEHCNAAGSKERQVSVKSLPPGSAPVRGPAATKTAAATTLGELPARNEENLSEINAKKPMPVTARMQGWMSSSLRCRTGA